MIRYHKYFLQNNLISNQISRKCIYLVKSPSILTDPSKLFWHQCQLFSNKKLVRNSAERNELNNWLKNFKSVSDLNATSIIQKLVKSGDLIRAERLYEFHKTENNKKFQLNEKIILHFVNTMVNNKQYEAAEDFIANSDWSSSHKVIASKENQLLLRSIFDTLSKRSELSELETFIDKLIFTQKYPSLQTLQHVMQIFLLDHDKIETTLDIFRRIVSNFQKTPYVQELICKLITVEDVESLEEILSLTTKIHGKRNSFFRMAFAFTTCNRIDQAKKIFQSLEINENDYPIDETIDYHQTTGQAKYLLNLLNATEGCAPAKHRIKMYEALIELMANANESKKLTELCSAMEAERLTPSKENSKKVLALLKKRNVKIPNSWILSHDSQEDDVDSKMRQLLDENQLTEANALLEDSLNQQKPLKREVLRYLLTKNSQEANTELFERLRTKFDGGTKDVLKFALYECKAYIKAENPSEYISLLQKRIQQPNADLKLVVRDIPIELISFLNICPEAYDDFKTLSLKIAEEKFLKPLAILWTYNYINDKNVADNEMVWQNYFQNNLPFACKQISKILFHQKQIDKLIDFISIQVVEKHRIDKKHLGKCYSYLFDRLYLENRHETIIDELKKALKVISVDDLEKRTLQRLKLNNSLVQQFWNVVNAAKLSTISKS